MVKDRPNDGRINADHTAILYRKLSRKDGSVFIVELNARMLPDGKIIAILRDITERTQTEDKLKKGRPSYLHPLKIHPMCRCNGTMLRER